MLILAHLTSSSDRGAVLRGAAGKAQGHFFGSAYEVARNIDNDVAGVILDLYQGSAAEVEAVCFRLRRSGAPMIAVARMDATTVKLAVQYARSSPDCRMAVRGFVTEKCVVDLFRENWRSATPEILARVADVAPDSVLN